MATVSELLGEVPARPGDDLHRDAQILLCAALEKPRTYLMAWPDAAVSASADATYRAWLQRRQQGEPVAYLLGKREFWSLPLTVTPATLIPRPETELLIECALELSLPGDARVVDLGTGSGAIALALAHERPHWQVTGVDVSAEALEVARANAESLGLARVDWRLGNWLEPLGTERFSLIVSNPPYVTPDDPHLEMGDLPFEPRSALVAGEDGFADLRLITEAAPDHLVPEGWLMLEHGFEQGEGVRDLLTRAGFEAVRSHRDLSGQERISVGRHASE